jgi:hypothetical protein
MSATLVSVHQPNFLPWLKLLDKILASDVYVAYDTVQYAKSEYHARQKIKTRNGPDWLSVPLRHRRGARQLIKDIPLDNSQPFRRRHLRTLHNGYASTPYFEEVYPLVEEVYGREQERLVELNVDLIGALCGYLRAPVRIVRASDLPHHGDKAERLVDLVRAAGGTAHLTSTYGGDHQEVDWTPLVRAGIPLVSQEFEHPVYDQVGREFLPHLAAIDMLFSCGPKTAEILAGRRRLARVQPDIGDRREPATAGRKEQMH